MKSGESQQSLQGIASGDRYFPNAAVGGFRAGENRLQFLGEADFCLARASGHESGYSTSPLARTRRDLAVPAGRAKLRSRRTTDGPNFGIAIVLRYKGLGLVCNVPLHRSNRSVRHALS
jgi:hypothetical protein